MPRSKKSGGGARPKSNKFRSNEHSDSESKFCSDINGSLQTYESNMSNFRTFYIKWLRERKITLSKLEELVKDVHEDQLDFNRTGLFFKEANMVSRQMKNENNPNVDFFASLAAFITDAVDGVNSIAQACNVDKYMKQFGEIMENDAEVTKQLHRMRSRCFAQYHNVEEIIRRYHSETFGSTMDRLSQSLRTEDMWMEVKSSRNGNDITQVIEAVDRFFQQVSRAEVLNEISTTVGSYLDSNPAVLEAVESTGKALYGAYDTWGRKRDTDDRSVVSSRISSGVNNALLMREQRDIRRLQSLTLDEDIPQAKLESKIHEAIEDLEREMEEMKILYERSIHEPNASFGYEGSNSAYNQFNFL